MVREAGDTALLGARYGAATVSIVGLVTIIAFEALAVSTAMPEVAAALGSGSTYGLAFSLLFTGQLFGIVTAGAWAQRCGPLPAVWTGQLLFASGSAVAGLAPTFDVMLAGRLVAGLGAGLAMVSLYVIVGAVYPLAMRPRVFGWLSAAWVLPSIVGPLVAAWLTHAVSWRAVFLVIVPLAAASAVGMRRAATLLREGPGPEYAAGVGEPPAPIARSGRRTLALGAGVTVGAAALQLGASGPGWSAAVEAALVVVGLAVLAVFVPRVLPPGSVRLRRGQPCVMVARLLLMAGFSGTISFVPLMLHGQVGLDLRATGALLALASIGWTCGSLIQGRPAVAGRGPELVFAGTVILSLSCLALVAADALELPAWVFAVILPVFGLALGLGVTSTSVLALALAPPGGHASASSSIQVADVLGSVLGVAAAGAVFAAGANAGWGEATTFPLIWLAMCLVATLGMAPARRIRL